jgi:hypothetical protein
MTGRITGASPRRPGRTTPGESCDDTDIPNIREERQERS